MLYQLIASWLLTFEMEVTESGSCRHRKISGRDQHVIILRSLKRRQGIQLVATAKSRMFKSEYLSTGYLKLELSAYNHGSYTEAQKSRATRGAYFRSRSKERLLDWISQAQTPAHKACSRTGCKRVTRGTCQGKETSKEQSQLSVTLGYLSRLATRTTQSRSGTTCSRDRRLDATSESRHQ